jgi:hypothetical protein
MHAVCGCLLLCLWRCGCTVLQYLSTKGWSHPSSKLNFVLGSLYFCKYTQSVIQLFAHHPDSGFQTLWFIICTSQSILPLRIYRSKYVRGVNMVRTVFDTKLKFRWGLVHLSKRILLTFCCAQWKWYGNINIHDVTSAISYCRLVTNMQRSSKDPKIWVRLGQRLECCVRLCLNLQTPPTGDVSGNTI